MPNNDDKRNADPVERQMEATMKDVVCSYSNLLVAETRCHRRVGYKNSVSKYHMYVMSRCSNLHKELMEDRYRTTYGSEFEIFEPKHRVVTSTAYRDRVPQTSFVLNCIYPLVIPNLIENNYACIKGRGVEAARNEFKRMIRDADMSDYVLVLDLTGYFDSIDHAKLAEEIYQYITDEWARWYFLDVIGCNGKDKGIGLGSEINQLSATSLPNRADHILSEMNGEYERYMDDFRFVGTKSECEEALEVIKQETERLKLKISWSKTYIQPISRPVKFLGFSYYKKPTGRVTMKRLNTKKVKERRKLRRMKEKGIPMERIGDHVKSVRAVMKKGTRSDLMKYDRYVKELFGEEIEKWIQ